MDRETMKQNILLDEGYGIVIEGYWYRTDRFDERPNQIQLTSGPEGMPPTYKDVYADLDELLEHMATIADLDAWLPFDQFYEA